VPADAAAIGQQPLPYDEDLGREQEYVTMLYGRLDGLRERAASRLAWTLRESGGTPAARTERDVSADMFSTRIAQLDAAENGLCFGRLDFAGQERRYIGRMGIRDESAGYEPLLLDWRAPAARPFYLGTAAPPEAPESGILEFHALSVAWRTPILAASARSLLSPVQPLTLNYERERLEDVGYLTCMTLVLLGNYAQTGHFGGPLAYTPYNVAIHLAGPDFGGMRYDYRRPKHPYGDKFMLAGGHCIPTCYALWMIMGEALLRIIARPLQVVERLGAVVAPSEVVGQSLHRRVLRLFERFADILPTPTHEPPPGIEPLMLRSMQAFWRDLPELLRNKRNRGKWVAYHGDERVGFGKSQAEMFQECFRRGLRDVEFYVGKIEPDDIPPWGNIEVEESLYDVTDEGEPPPDDS